MGDQQKAKQCSKCFTQNLGDSAFCNKCGADLELEHDTLSYSPYPDFYKEESIHLSPGDTFSGRYQIIEEIGRGGMGRVFKAQDKELDIVVALKIIRPKYSAKPRFIEWFKKETLTARSISHENVVRIYDMGSANDIKYISMEYIRGQNLKDLIRASGALTIKKTIDIANQISYALKAAHKHGIIHRDLKPSNIMVDNNGKVYVMDFGIARAVQESKSKKTKGITGTPQYMSPEQAKGEEIDQRSDIYSLGLIIYEMLAGRPAFKADDITEYLQKQIYEKPDSPKEFNPNTPPELEKITLKCLEKDREKRFQNVEALLEDLQKIEKTSKPSIVKKRRLKAALGAAAMTVIVALVVLLWKPWTGITKAWIPSVEDGRISIAVMEFENHTGDASLDPYRRSLQEYLIINLEQSEQIHVYSEKQLNQILGEIEQRDAIQDPVEVLNAIALKEPVSFFVLGSIGGDKENLTISAQIWDARDHIIIYQGIEPPDSIDELSQMIRNMSVKIRSKFLATLSETEDLDSNRGIVTTTSPEARKFYEEAAIFYAEHKYDESIKLLERAVDLDPGFAMAYRLMAFSNSYLGYRNKVKEYLEIALKQKAVSESERLLVQADYSYIVEKDNDKAIKIYRNLIEKYPEYETPKLMLAALYLNLEEWDLALEWYNKVLESSNNVSDNAWNNIAFICMAKGWYDFARNIFQRNRDIFVDKAYCHRNVTHTYIYKGEYDLALLEIEKALAIKPDDFRSKALLGNIYQCKEDFISSQRCYQELVASKDPEIQVEGHFWMVRLYLSMGMYDNCMAEIGEGLAVAQNNELLGDELNLLLYQIYLNYQQDSSINDLTEKVMTLDRKQALFWRGLDYIQQNEIEEAEKTALQLRQLIEETGIRKHMRYHSYLKGMIAFSDNQLDKSIGHFTSAISDMPSVVYSLDDHAMYFDSMASACYKNGNLAKAKEYYARITELTWGKLPYGDLYAKSFYWLGRIQHEQGQKDEATENLNVFLSLWKDADPAHPEIEDARQRVSSLRPDISK